MNIVIEIDEGEHIYVQRWSGIRPDRPDLDLLKKQECPFLIFPILFAPN